MVSSVSLLSVFCAAMAAVSLGQLALTDDRDPVDVGNAVIVVGIAVLSVLWAAIDRSVTALGVRLTLGIVGTALVGLGVVIVARYWDG